MLNKILGGIIGFIALVFALGFVLPDRAHLEREIIIEAPAEEVYALVSDFSAWEEWSPWAKMDPQAEYELTGAGVGQTMVWHSDHPNVGDGKQEIIALAEPGHVVTRLNFGPMGVADAAFTLTPITGDRTKVVWSFDSNMREGTPTHLKPVLTYMGYVMGPMLGPVYDEGLQNLKQAAEAD
jgi:uncharacterized protein YndB with AHSA1/START domain